MSALFINNKNIFEETPVKYAEKVVNTNISIPAFQRNYAWNTKPKKITDLLESIYCGFNLGTVVVWESKENGISRKTQNILNNNIEHNTIEYIVDGQQRTLTLVSLLTKQNIVNLDLNSFFIQFNPVKGKLFFEYKKPNAEYPYITFGSFKEKMLFNQEGLVDLRDFAKNWNEQSIVGFENELEKVFKRNLRSAEIVVGYKLQIGATDLNLAIKQFEKINKTGMVLSELDILDSLAFSDNNYEMKKYIPELKNTKFAGLISSQGIYSSDLKKIIMNSYKLIKNYKDKSRVSLDAAAISNFQAGDTGIIDSIFKKLFDCLAELNNLNINDLKDIPYTLNIVTYIFIKWWCEKEFGSDDIENYSNKEFLMAIMFLTGIQSSYEKSSSSKLITHLNKIKVKIKSGESIYFNDADSSDKTLFDFNSNDVKSTSYKNISAVEKAIFLYWINTIEIKDYLKKDTKLTLMGIFKNKDNLDHIFPKSSYERISRKDVHSLANIAIVTSETNKKKLKKDPSDFFGKIPYSENFEMYKSHTISNEAYDHLIKNEFQLFIQQRSDDISYQISEYIEYLKNLV